MSAMGKLDFSEFMQGMINAPFTESICKTCGGTGFKPVMCCNGYECGCHGLPVDFQECDKCKSEKLSDDAIRNFIPK